MTNQITTETELELAEKTVNVETFEALKRLQSNKDFQLVIVEGYLKRKAIEFTSLLSTEYARRNNLRGTIMEELIAISAFEQYLLDLEALGMPPVEDDEDFEYAD